MAEIPRINPQPMGYENVSKPSSIAVNEKTIQNIVDPTRVTRSDGKNGNAEKELGLKYESNFTTFLEMLRNTPNVTDMLSELMFQMGGELEGVPQNGFLLQLSQLLKSMQMTEQELLVFLKEQAAASGKFHGAFFRGLQGVLEQTKSPQLQREILNFLKTYNEVSSSPSTLKKIQSILQNISENMTSQYRKTVDEFSQQISTMTKSGTFGKQEEIATFLKRDVLPFLGTYIKNTNNMGRVRDLITMFTLNVVKYENADVQKLENSFRTLMDFRDFRSVFSQMGVDDLRRMVTMESEMDFSKQFAQLIQSGMKGEGGWETKAAFENVMQALLLNESVYMPLAHFLVPATIAGRTMLSEIWVDPNHQEKRERGQREQGRRLLIKFNIKEIGFFDLIITQKKSGVDLELYYPETLKKAEGTIRKEISSIMEKNGMPLKTFSLNVSHREKKLEEVFPQIYERINTVDVKI